MLTVTTTTQTVTGHLADRAHLSEPTIAMQKEKSAKTSFENRKPSKDPPFPRHLQTEIGKGRLI